MEEEHTQPAGQARCVAGACLVVTIEWGTVGSSCKPGAALGIVGVPIGAQGGDALIPMHLQELAPEFSNAPFALDIS